MTDIIDRLENEEMCIDAIDDAIAEIKRLRELLTGFVTVLALNPSQKERQERNDKIQELWERSCEVLGLSGATS